MNSVALQQDNWAAGLNHNQAKALNLLGQGISPVMVASTLGVSESLISQYISEPRFSEEVTKLKLATLQMQTSIDSKHMKAEDMLLDKLIKTIPLISKPMDILRGIQVINATKRRGLGDTPVPTNHTQIVNIQLPPSMAARFVTNTANQIVEIHDDHGSRSLVTSTPEAVSRFAIEASEPATIEYTEVNGSTENLADSSWQAGASTEDRIKSASAILAKLSVKETGGQRQVSSTTVKRQITADDL